MADTVVDALGKTWHIHDKDTCLGQWCPFHKPSDHEHNDKPWLLLGKHVVRVLPDDSKVLDPDDFWFHQQGRAIVINRASCMECGDVVTSETRHHFASCQCGQMFVDGGQEYLRRGGKYNERSWIETKDKDL